MNTFICFVLGIAIISINCKAQIVDSVDNGSPSEPPGQSIQQTKENRPRALVEMAGGFNKAIYFAGSQWENYYSIGGFTAVPASWRNTFLQFGAEFARLDRKDRKVLHYKILVLSSTFFYDLTFFQGKCGVRPFLGLSNMTIDIGEIFALKDSKIFKNTENEFGGRGGIALVYTFNTFYITVPFYGDVQFSSPQRFSKLTVSLGAGKVVR